MGCSLQRIKSQIHRRGACMVSPALDRDPEVLQACNGSDDAKIYPFIKEDATLLNVQFQECRYIGADSFSVSLRSQTDSLHGFGNRDALCIAYLLKLNRINASQDRFCPPTMCRETAAFLFT